MSDKSPIGKMNAEEGMKVGTTFTIGGFCAAFAILTKSVLSYWSYDASAEEVAALTVVYGSILQAGFYLLRNRW